MGQSTNRGFIITTSEIVAIFLFGILIGAIVGCSEFTSAERGNGDAQVSIFVPVDSGKDTGSQDAGKVPLLEATVEGRADSLPTEAEPRDGASLPQYDSRTDSYDVYDAGPQEAGPQCIASACPPLGGEPCCKWYGECGYVTTLGNCYDPNGAGKP